jgi:hypothetical protein
MGLFDPVVPDEQSFRVLQRTTERVRNIPDRGQRQSHQHSPHAGPPTVRFKNTASGVVPAWGVMRITTDGTADYLAAAKPDATYRWIYLINGSTDVAVDGYGFGSFLTADQFSLTRGFALYDTGATPAYGERWGPKADSWLLWQHRPGFFVLGANTGTSTTSRTAVIQLPPGEVRIKNDDGSGTLAAGGTGRTFGIYGGTAGTSDTGLEVTINNGSSVAWAADKYGWATADAGGAIWGAPHQT